MTEPRGPVRPPVDFAERLDRLIAAANDLASTIARTERIAVRTADVAALRPPGPGWDGDGRSVSSGGDRLVPLAEVARRTGRHPDLLRRWCLDGRLEGVRVGRAWCLPERSIGRLGRFQRRHHGRRPGGPGDPIRGRDGTRGS